MMKILYHWLPLAIVTTIIFGTIYVVVQQSYRQNANDPQIQLAEDAASDIAHDRTISFPEKTVEISESLAPYLIMYDESTKQVTGSAVLHGNQPVLPPGVFLHAKNQLESRFTWQPELGVRQAVVLRYVAQKGYVLAGRSLREVEIRESMLLGFTFFGWITSLFGSLIAVSLLTFARNGKRS